MRQLYFVFQRLICNLHSNFMKNLLLIISLFIFNLSFGQLSYGTKIGQTYYDLQSNSSKLNNIVRNNDGSVSVVWTEHWDVLENNNQPNFSVRGFGYNHYDTINGWIYGEDGECWADNYGCASSYVGWPQIINLNTPNSEGYQEMVINHTPLKITKRGAIGNGNWSNTEELTIDLADDTSGASHPRTVSNESYIHMIGLLNFDQNPLPFIDSTTRLRYFRSSNGGVTWDIQGANVFNQVGEIIKHDTSYIPNNIIISIDTTINSIIDSTWNDTLLGVSSIYGYIFNPSSGTIDTSISNTDTIVQINSALTSDTAFVLYTAYNTITVYDTTFSLDTIVSLDTIQDLHINSVDADGYQIATNGNYVAVTLGAGFENDWMVFISSDNGTTWTRRLVANNHRLEPDFYYNNYGPFYKINNDNFDILIDDNGTVHAFSGSNFASENSFNWEGGGQLYKDYNMGIMYWNSTMPDNSAKVIATPDYSTDGDTSTYNANDTEYYGFYTAGWPSASYDANGNIYLIYSAIAENIGIDYVKSNGDTIGYMDLYYTNSKDNGATWGAEWGIYDGDCCCYIPNSKNHAINIAKDIYGLPYGTPTEDDVFPSTIKKIGDDGILHFTWQGDVNRPGLALIDGSHPNDKINYIMAGAFNVFESYGQIGKTPRIHDKNGQGTDCTGIGEEILSLNKINIKPNPAKNYASISSDASTIKNIEIFN